MLCKCETFLKCKGKTFPFLATSLRCKHSLICKFASRELYGLFQDLYLYRCMIDRLIRGRRIELNPPWPEVRVYIGKKTPNRVTNSGQILPLRQQLYINPTPPSLSVTLSLLFTMFHEATAKPILSLFFPSQSLFPSSLFA